MKFTVGLLGLAATSMAAMSIGPIAPIDSTPGPFWQSLRPGPFAIGYRVIYRHEKTRAWLSKPNGSDLGRPIRVSVWYPVVTSNSGAPMKYGDYLHHDPTPTGFEEITQKLDASDMESEKSDFHELTPDNKDTLPRILALPVAARRNADPAPGRYPLVLYSGGKASRADANVELEEFLASNGYVVVTVPQLGPTDSDLEPGSSPDELALHADDLDSALKIVHDLSFVAAHTFAAIGHSAGAEVAIELAFRHPKLKAVIGLDGSFGTKSGANILMRLPGYQTTHKLRAALLDLRRADGSQGARLDLTAVDAVRWSRLYRKTCPGAFHGDFTEWGMVAFVAAVPMPPNSDAHTRQIGVDVNRATCQYVLDFLNYQMRGSKNSAATLKDLRK